MDKLKAMATFVRIIDAGSLSAAAEVSGQSTASVVRSLAALEQHLGVRLLNRTTRRLALTDEGTEFLAWSRRVLREFDEIEHGFDARRQVPNGLLRLTAPVEFGRHHVVPLINEFLSQHPTIRVELTLLDHMVDLLDEGLDLAIRIGRLPDSSLVAVPLGKTRLVVCAAPSFLHEDEPIRHPSSLPKYSAIVLTSQGRHWHFQDHDRAITEVVSARLTTNQVQVAHQACLQGLGIARLLHYQVATALNDGLVVRLLREFEPPELPIQMVYPHARLLPPRVRQFIDWAAPRLRASIPDPA